MCVCVCECVYIYVYYTYVSEQVVCNVLLRYIVFFFFFFSLSNICLMHFSFERDIMIRIQQSRNPKHPGTEPRQVL